MQQNTQSPNTYSAPLGAMPLGGAAIEPPGPPDNPGVQLPPPEFLPPAQSQTPHPEPETEPQAGVPMTDGTPLPCRQKNAREFLRGNSLGVMQQYGGGMFGAQQHTHSAQPAPENAEQAVRALARWREEAPYG